MTGPGDRRPPDDRAGFLGWYQRAWNDLDLDRILAAYATPCFVVKGGRVLHHRDDAAKARYFADLLDGNRRQGPHRWDLSDLEQRPLGRATAWRGPACPPTGCGPWSPGPSGTRRSRPPPAGGCRSGSRWRSPRPRPSRPRPGRPGRAGRGRPAGSPPPAR